MHAVKRTVETSVNIKIISIVLKIQKPNCNVDQLQRNFWNSQTVPSTRKKKCKIINHTISSKCSKQHALTFLNSYWEQK